MQQSLRYEVCASTTPTSSPSITQSEEKKKKKMYKQPDQPLAARLWRFWLWISVTFGLSVMEPWEKLFVAIVVAFILGLIGLGFVRFIPQFISVSLARTRYYLLG
ncbi:hypothetical protein ACEPAG_8983 [Sanghuangporus baumii]